MFESGLFSALPSENKSRTVPCASLNSCSIVSVAKFLYFRIPEYATAGLLCPLDIRRRYMGYVPTITFNPSDTYCSIFPSLVSNV